ncbi:RES family NAD+ phosphorylase [Algoriphagus sp. oki45]|uniref:RES family NAD+ phosphorylase n=1 Tax=Algoriphagus sp. oki45 TaxID=3067294 RepID=UPI0027EAB5BA|nr:RES family NAD+ phosphorylase [Algoriphagus sp. oki45]
MRYFRLIENLPGRNSLGYGLGPGRWNPFGTPMIYACSVSALNFLELLSIKGPIVTQSHGKLVLIEITGSIPDLDPETLAPDWKNRPYPRSTQEFGGKWAKSMLSLSLKIPSCRLPLSSYPDEHNLLINPLHPDFSSRVKVLEEWDVSFEVNQ